MQVELISLTIILSDPSMKFVLSTLIISDSSRLEVLAPKYMVENASSRGHSKGHNEFEDTTIA